MIPAFEHHPNSCFLGFPMSQNRYAIPAWSYLLEKVRPASIVEIGTSEGGMSVLLAVAASCLGASFDTFDVGETMNKFAADALAAVCRPGCGFHPHDVFGLAGQSLIKARIGQPGTSILLCDGGNKGKEFSNFAPHLKPGDIIGVHDARGRESWPWKEFDPAGNYDLMVENELSEFMPDVFLETGWFVCRKGGQ
jgi:hypothetical protein